MTKNPRKTADDTVGNRPPMRFLTTPSEQLRRSVKTSERIAAALVEDVIREGLQPGDRLPNEAAMTERFGVGRGSLREALRILEVYGLISLKAGPGGGPVLQAVDPREVGRTFSLYLSLRGARIAELIEARLFIEPMVARLAAENRDPEALRRLENVLKAEAAADGEEYRYLDAANDFHYVVASMTGNNVFDLVATALKELYTTKVVAAGIAALTVQPSICLEHREIGQAVLDGRADDAERLMREHMTFYLGSLRNTEPNFTRSQITWG
ncbi:FadR/GntR family transcriptional regulator [Streptomyces sp. NBC_01320]|uniref:FadR/GntR family transcriptional regulator n=1 Tax=Streptomyces sp. NBC_01320 TaxID=2903824 RepID=UPI002E0E288F|nr:FadR family transcriptional regulator [Streptomyces sp. NBC_01320]